MIMFWFKKKDKIFCKGCLFLNKDILCECKYLMWLEIDDFYEQGSWHYSNPAINNDRNDCKYYEERPNKS